MYEIGNEVVVDLTIREFRKDSRKVSLTGTVTRVGRSGWWVELDEPIATYPSLSLMLLTNVYVWGDMIRTGEEKAQVQESAQPQTQLMFGQKPVAPKSNRRKKRR